MIAQLIVHLAWVVAVVVALFIPARRQLLVWGPHPLINLKYWSAAMSETGRESRTLVSEVYANYSRDDFDLLWTDLVPRAVPGRLRSRLARYFAFWWVIRNTRVLHLPYTGFCLGDTLFQRLEPRLYRFHGIKTVIVPFGADIYLYSRVTDPSSRHVLQINYPAAARAERSIQGRVTLWSEQADFIVATWVIDGIGRWDALANTILCIDLGAWVPRARAGSRREGDAVVRVVHAPNHRAIKGTEFLVRAVENLRRQHVPIELTLLERVPNHEVRRLLASADLVVDQLILHGYGMFAVEAMACGVPVIANLGTAELQALFRRYAHLDECPVVSATPESIEDVLRDLATDPLRRDALGAAGREYAVRHHSYQSTQALFSSIYDELFGVVPPGSTMLLSHPLLGPLARQDWPLHEPAEAAPQS